MVQNLRLPGDGERTVAHLLRGAEFLLYTRAQRSQRRDRRFPGKRLLVEFVAARNVFLWHDRLSGGVLSERLGSLAVLPARCATGKDRLAAPRVVAVCRGDPASPRSIGLDFFAADGRITASVERIPGRQINRLDCRRGGALARRQCDLAHAGA